MYQFSAFCNYHDGTAYDNTTSYTESSHALLRTYSRLAQDVAPLDLLGTQALMYACIAPALQGANQMMHLPILLSAALHNLSSVKSENLYHTRGQVEQHKGSFTLLPTESRSLAGHLGGTDASAIEMQETSHRLQLEACSLNIIKHIFSSNDAGKIRGATNRILQYSESTKHLRDTWSSTLVRIAAEWVPINLRFHVLGACLEYLHSLEISDSSDATFERQSNALNIVYMLLTSKLSLIGLSTNDVMDSLLNLAYKLPPSYDGAYRILESSVDTKAASVTEAPDEIKIMHLRLLIRTILALTAHSYYKDQISDMFRFLLERTATAEFAEELHGESYQGFQLDVAKQLLEVSWHRQDSERPCSNVKPMCLLPGITLLRSTTYIRRKFANVIYTFLKTECSPKVRSPTACIDVLSDHEQHHELARLIRNAMYFYLKNTDQDMPDFNLGFDIVINLHRLLPLSELVILVPLLYRLDQESHENPMMNQRFISAWRSRLQDTVMRVIDQCCPNKDIAIPTVMDNHETPLPELPVVVRQLRSCLSSELAESQMLTISEVWNPEEADRSMSRTVSVRNMQRGRLVSSATASREQFDLGSGTIMAGRPATGRISGLRQYLASAKDDSSAPLSNLAGEVWTNDPSIDMLFKDIDIKPLGTLEDGTPVSTEHQKDQQVEYATQVSAQPLELDTSLHLGRIVA